MTENNTASQTLVSATFSSPNISNYNPGRYMKRTTRRNLKSLLERTCLSLKQGYKKGRQ